MKISTINLAAVGLLSLPFTGASLMRGSHNNQGMRKLQGNPVYLDFWTSPRLDWDEESTSGGSTKGPNIDAISTLRKVEVAFGTAVQFDINMYVNVGDGVCPTMDINGNPLDDQSINEICDNSCTNERRYCEPPPKDNFHKNLLGNKIVEESLRRQCIWNRHHDNDDWDEEKKLFDYLTTYHARGCDSKYQYKEQRCVSRALDDAKLDEADIQQCMEQSGGLVGPVDNSILMRQTQKQNKRGINNMPTLPIVFINGHALDEISESYIFAAICKVLPEDQQIEACNDLIMEEELGDVDSAETAEEVDQEVEEIAQEMGQEEDLGMTEEQQEEMAQAEEYAEEDEELTAEEQQEIEQHQEEGGEDLDEEEEAEEEEYDEEQGETLNEEEEFEEEESEEEEEELGEEAMEALEEGVDTTSEEPQEPLEGEMPETPEFNEEGEEPAEGETTEPGEPVEGEGDETPAFPPDGETPQFPEEGEAPAEGELDGEMPTGEETSQFPEEGETPADEGVPMEGEPLEGEQPMESEQVMEEQPMEGEQMMESENMEGEQMMEGENTEGEPMDSEQMMEGENTEGEPMDGEQMMEGENTESENMEGEQTIEGEPSEPSEFEGENMEDEMPEKPEEEEEVQFDVPLETSPPQMEGLNSFGEQGDSLPLAETRTEEPIMPETTPTPPGPGEVGEAENLDSLDLSLVDIEVSHLEALNNCGVDTALLMNKLLALGNSGKLKQEAEDIEADVPLLMTQNCPHDEGLDILHRLRDFHGCAMFDLQELIETFPSTAVGVAVRCANAYSNMTKEEEERGHIPEACIRTVEASSVLGRGMFGLFLYPDVACPCFEKLGDSIPECTADVWPIPINGALLKTQSCLVGQYCQTIDGLCEDNMKILNECLPPRGTKKSAMQCDEIFQECADVYDQMHPLLNSAPLPDACVRIAQGSTFYGTHLVERYDAFRHQCGRNIELWEGHSKVAEFKSFVQEGVYGIDYQSVPFVTGAVGGFLAGIVFAIVFIIVRNFCICLGNCLRRLCDCICCRKKKKNQRPKTKDYSTVDTNGDEVEAYRD